MVVISTTPDCMKHIEHSKHSDHSEHSLDSEHSLHSEHSKCSGYSDESARAPSASATLRAASGVHDSVC